MPEDVFQIGPAHQLVLLCIDMGWTHSVVNPELYHELIVHGYVIGACIGLNTYTVRYEDLKLTEAGILEVVKMRLKNEFV